MKKIAGICMMLLAMMSCTSGGDDDYVSTSMLETGTDAPDFLIVTTDQPEGFLLSSL